MREKERDRVSEWRRVRQSVKVCRLCVYASVRDSVLMHMSVPIHLVFLSQHQFPIVLVLFLTLLNLARQKMKASAWVSIKRGRSNRPSQNISRVNVRVGCKFQP